MNVTWPQWLLKPFEGSSRANQSKPDPRREEATELVRQHLRDQFSAGRSSVPNPSVEAAWAEQKRLQIGLYSALECPVIVYKHVQKPEQRTFPCWVMTQQAPELARAQRILDRLLSVAPNAPRVTALHMIQSLQPNAVAFGAGKFGVTDTLLKRASNDDELAFVLVHELAHEQHRDNPGLARVMNGTPRLLARLIGLGQTPDHAGRMFEQELKRLQQRAESEADTKAIAWMRDAGYDPQGAVTFLRTLQKSEQGREKQMTGDHPPTSERIKAIEGLIKNRPPM